VRVAAAGWSISERDADKGISWRFHAAIHRAHYGQVDIALAEFTELLPDVARFFGEHHPWIRKITEQIESWSNHDG
jgi:hypothetical protein